VITMKRAGFLVAAIAAAGVMTGAGTATAGTQAESAIPAPPPRCVTATEDTGLLTDTVHVWNGCAFNVRVKVLVAFGPDSACTNVMSSTGFTHSYPSIGRFDGLEAC
jgi:hypothetical protein